MYDDLFIHALQTITAPTIQQFLGWVLSGKSWGYFIRIPSAHMSDKEVALKYHRIRTRYTDTGEVLDERYSNECLCQASLPHLLASIFKQKWMSASYRNGYSWCDNIHHKALVRNWWNYYTVPRYVCR